jgi:hypothetical protein
MKNLDEILRGLVGLMKYSEKLSNEDCIGEYRRRYEHLWYYWRALKDALVLPIQSIPLLRDGFWPETRIASTTKDQFSEDGSVCK